MRVRTTTGQQTIYCPHKTPRFITLHSCRTYCTRAYLAAVKSCSCAGRSPPGWRGIAPRSECPCGCRYAALPPGSTIAKYINKNHYYSRNVARKYNAGRGMLSIDRAIKTTVGKKQQQQQQKGQTNGKSHVSPKTYRGRYVQHRPPYHQNNRHQRQKKTKKQKNARPRSRTQRDREQERESLFKISRYY